MTQSPARWAPPENHHELVTIPVTTPSGYEAEIEVRIGGYYVEFTFLRRLVGAARRDDLADWISKDGEGEFGCGTVILAEVRTHRSRYVTVTVPSIGMHILPPCTLAQLHRHLGAVNDT